MKYIYFLFCLVATNITLSQDFVLNEDFNNNNNNWPLYDKDEIKGEIKNGEYIIESIKDKAKWFYVPVEENFDQKDFVLEAKMTQLSGYDNYGFGVLFNMYSDNSDYRAFFASSNGHVKFDHYFNKETHANLAWKKSSAVNPMKQENIFRVEKNANIIRLFINGEKVYESGKNGYFGGRFGFYLANKMKVKVDYIKITTTDKKINLIENYKLDLPKVKLGTEINDENYTETIPVISADGKTLYCVRKHVPESAGGYGGDDVWYSTLDDQGNWSVLQNMGGPINNEGHNFVISVSPDNNTLTIANTYNPDGTKLGGGVSITTKTPQGWSIPTKVEVEDFKNINDYVGYSMAPDNKTLVMAVERPEGKGEKDLYVSFLQASGTWTKPMNMGILNTFGDETTPVISPDNKTLYFSSNGHPGYGYHDVFVSRRLDDTWVNWSEPQNLGDNINSQNFELGYFVAAKGDVAYLSSNSDIYRIGNPAKLDPVTLVKGKVLNKKTNEPISARIQYYDLATEKELGIAISDPVNGDYQIALPTGVNYGFLAEKEDFYSITENIDLTELTEYTELTKDLFLSPIIKGETIRLNSIFFVFNKDVIRPESTSELNRLLKFMTDNPSVKIELSGHTDDVGFEKYNQQLSQKRAKAIYDFLVKNGIEGDRMTFIGYGKSQPLVKNEDEESRAINRRVEFKILDK